MTKGEKETKILVILVHGEKNKDINVLRWWKDNKGERNKDISDRGRTWHRGRDMARDMTKEMDQLKFWAHK